MINMLFGISYSMNYIPVTDEEKRQMLSSIGVSKVEELFRDMKPRLSRKLDLPAPMAEMELKKHLWDLSRKNVTGRLSFIGGGSYNHYSPSAVNHILLRSEFYTSYTPYQPEASQGMLQVIYEFQTYVCLLTGMDVANASMYDGSSAFAETAIMASEHTKRKEVFVHGNVNPQYQEVLKTYCNARDLKISDKMTENTACVMVQNPDFLGNVEDIEALAKQAHEHGALLVVCVTEPTSLAILPAPGELGADMVAGEFQGFGIPVSFGGPYTGFLAVKKNLIRRLPGRLCGKTLDAEGSEGFMLTLQAREQHIRREKATSNICTNEALMALACTVYLALMGKTGLQRVAELSYERTHSLQENLLKLGFRKVNEKPFYDEFALQSPKEPKRLLAELFAKGFVGGIDIGQGRILFCCTEMNREEDVEAFVKAVKESL